MKFLSLISLLAATKAETLFDDESPSQDVTLVSEKDLEFWETLNDYRTDPTTEATNLGALIEGRSKTDLITKDGLKKIPVSDITALIEFLNNMTPLQEVRWYQGIARGCAQKISNYDGLVASELSAVKARYNMFGALGDEADVYEALDDSGSGSTAVLGLMANEASRTQLMSADFEGVGVFSFSTDELKYTCAGLASAYTDDVDKIGGATCGYYEGECDETWDTTEVEPKEDKVDPESDSDSEEAEKEESGGSTGLIIGIVVVISLLGSVGGYFFKTKQGQNSSPSEQEFSNVKQDSARSAAAK